MAADRPIIAWCGNYRFGRDESFAHWAQALARFVDPTPEKRKQACFREELDRLRPGVPADGREVLAQLEHRWRHPKCSASLYVMTCALEGVLDDGGHPAQAVVCTKVGEAKHTIAGRFQRYRTRTSSERMAERRPPSIDNVRVAEGSQSLRILIYG